MSTDQRLQRIGVWGGMVAWGLIGVFFMGFGRFVPPLSPTSSAQEITQFFVDHTVRTRVAIALSLLASAAALPWLATICLQIRRIEGRWGILSVTQIFAGVLFVPGFLFPFMILAAASFRPEQRSPEITQMLNDLFWLMAIGLIEGLVVQALVLTVATFMDHGDVPVFPRWFGYVNIWFVLLALPAGAVVIFTSGPLAWNGIFAFWIPIPAFTAWIVVVTLCVRRAIISDEP